jgi:hypothetical protein
MRRPRLDRSAAIALGLGAVIALAAQVARPSRAPMYDGVPITEPYRFLDPANGQAANPTAFTSSPGLDGGASRAFVAATTEQPPQAQLIALTGALVVPAGATAMNVSIEAVEPEQPPDAGAIAGNVYRFLVVDDSGNEYRIAAGSQPSLTLRAPEGVTGAVIGHRTSDGWVALATEHGGQLGIYQVVPTELGDYAILTGVSAPSNLATTIAIAVTIGLPILIAIGYFIRRATRDRRAAEAAAEAARARSRVPSKRRKRR